MSYSSVPQPGKLVTLMVVFAALLSVSAFLYRGYLRPLSRAVSDTQSEHVYDFGVRYYSAINLRQGINPYEKKQNLSPDQPKHGMGKSAPVYFPLVLSLYIPLSFLKFAQAQMVWLHINILFVCISAVCLFRLTGWPARPDTVAGIVLLVGCFLPIIRNLDSGQINLLILLLLALGFTALKTGHEAKAGMWMALAVLIKPLPAIVFIGALLRRKWTFLVSGIFIWLVSLPLSLLIFGAPVNFSFLKRLIFAESTVVSTWWSSQNLAGFFLRLFWSGGGNPERLPWLDNPLAAWILWGIGSFAVCYLTFRLTVKRASMPFGVCVSLWLITGFLISSRTWDHYFPWLLIPVVLLAAAYSRKNSVVNWMMFAIMYSLLAFPAVKYSSLPMFHSGPLLLMAGSQTMGMIFMYALLARHKWENDGCESR